MTDDQLFRLILAVGLAVFVPLALYRRVRSAASGEALDRRQEGTLVLVALRPLGLAMMIAVIAFAVSPDLMAWSTLALPAWLRWTGVAIGAMAGALLNWTFSHLGDNLTDTVVTRQRHTLVTTGPYAWVRHPFYTSVALAVVALTLVTANGFVLATGALAFAMIVIRCRKEEENLAARFGDEYAAYARRTGRFWPRWSGEQ